MIAAALELITLAARHWKAIGLLALVAAVPAAYAIGHWRGANAGRDKVIAEQAADAMEAELKRKGDDATLQAMSDYDLCVAGLRASGMQISACDELRGVREEQP